MWNRVSGNHQSKLNNMCKVNGDSDMVPVCQLCGGGGGFIKGAMTSASTFIKDKAASLTLFLKSDDLVTPHMTLVSFQLLPQYRRSEKVILCLCVGF